MREFFRPWRRKAGVVALVMALAYVAVWVRGGFYCDALVILIGRNVVSIQSGDGTNRAHLLLDRRRIMGGTSYADWDHYSYRTYGVSPLWAGVSLNRIFVPYWSIVIPLTLMSAWLLLGKPRPAKPIVRSEPDHA